MRPVAALTALLVGICAPAFAQSQRVEMGWDGNSGYFEHQTPTSDHPLAYFLSTERQQEFLHAATDNCADSAACHGVVVGIFRAEVATLFGKKVLQVVYSFTSKTSPGPGDSASPQPYWKSIIAETSPGQYREIFLLRNEGGFWTSPPSTAAVIPSGASRVLVTNDATTSRDMWCTGESWVSQESGLTLVDVSAVTATLERATPSGAKAITPMCAAMSFEKLEVRSLVRTTNSECNACGMEGSVIVKFRLDGAQAEPLSSRFVKGNPN